MNLKSRIVFLIGAWWSLTIGPLAACDVLTFVHDGQVDLPIVDHGPTLELVVPWGRLAFPRSAFRAITPTESIASIWRQREIKAEQTPSATSRFEAGWWALEQGLTVEAIAMFRKARATPAGMDHAPLARVGRMLDQLDLWLPPEQVARIETVLAETSFARLVGRHVVLLHQASPEEAAERLGVLDQVVETYYLSLAAQGIELRVPRNRLVSIWVARQADYVALLRRLDSSAFANTQGFYHPGFGVVFAFDTRSSSDQAVPRRELLARRNNPMLTSGQRVEIDRQTLLLDLRWRGVDLGIAAHETVHQLVACSGLAVRFDDWPHWLHEGFSAQFEVVRNGRWAGIGRTNDHRLPDWRSIQPAPQLAPLLRDAGLIHGYNRDHYAEAWSLVYFLRKTRPAEFVTFLQRLQIPHGPGIDARLQESFTTMFGGDHANLQDEWRRFMSQQTLPSDGRENHLTAWKSR